MYFYLEKLITNTFCCYFNICSLRVCISKISWHR